MVDGGTPPARRELTRRRVTRALAASVTAIAVVATVAVAAQAVVEQITQPADSDGRAERVVRAAEPGDVAVVYNIGELRADVAAAVESAARESGGAWSPSRSASVGLVAVRRGDAGVQQAPAGFRYPLIVTAMPRPVVAAVLGPDTADPLTADTVVMGERTAAIRGAQVGDVIDVVAADGSLVSLQIGAVLPDAGVGGAEVIMSTEAADRIGVVRSTRAVMWGFSSRTALDRALAANGIPNGLAEVRAVRSWDRPSPDSTLSTARTKELLGEFAFRVNSDGSMTQEAAWQDANLPAGRELLNSTIRIRARCHLDVVPDLRAALADVAAAGLAGAIDVGNANAYGGCHNPRYNRISGQLGFVSRHAWAMALDVNTVSNCQGCTPQLDCEVVRIFRRHGFAWGGNFLRPDGMHFEWVGERRDLLPYPSPYCPNDVPPYVESFVESVLPADPSRAVLFADHTLATGHDPAHEH